jgi:hypothetical protein|nr:MAG TPA: hypothetical protein [Caudoviricetes sp.]
MKQWTEEELINDGNRLRNAEITNVSLNFKDHGVLTLDLTLSGGGWGVVFGGYVLGHGYLGSENFEGSKAGLEAIMRIMDVVGVDDLIEMKGKHVRVATKGLGHSVKIIGNFIKDEWFDYESFFKDEKPPFVEE